MYISAVKFLKDHRNFKVDETFHLQPMTLLVGDQGCGKSTILTLLANRQFDIIEVALTPEGQKGVESFYFDFEKNNPRVKSPNDYSNVNGKDKGIGYGAALKSRFYSHGEVLIEFSVKSIQEAKNCILFLDEPESSLSLRNQYKLIAEIDSAIQRNCQFIISSHCLPLINYTKQVLSLEHKKWMPNKDFIESQRQ